MRRYGKAPSAGRNYTDRPGAYAVILRDGEALIVEQSGDFLLPGGGIEAGESVIQALHREIWEETGWSVQMQRRLGVFQRYCWLTEEEYWARKIMHVYLCRPVRRVSEPLETDHTPIWVDAGLAAQLLDAAGERAYMAHAIQSY